MKLEERKLSKDWSYMSKINANIFLIKDKNYVIISNIYFLKYYISRSRWSSERFHSLYATVPTIYHLSPFGNTCLSSIKFHVRGVMSKYFLIILSLILTAIQGYKEKSIYVMGCRTNSESLFNLWLKFSLLLTLITVNESFTWEEYTILIVKCIREITH